MLEINNISASYDSRNTILKNISIKVPEGKIITLIGANGAGKTTTMRTITGLLPLKAGSIVFNGKTISGLRPDKVTEMGIAMVPEGRRVFPKLTVKENLEVGGYKYRRMAGAIKKRIEAVNELFPILLERQSQKAGSLSGGEQQMLAIGRALMSDPKILLLDEPSLGLAPQVVRSIFTFITQINKQGITILLVEQNANLALKTSSYAYVLQNGSLLMEGPSDELRKNPIVEEAYLGTKR